MEQKYKGPIAGLTRSHWIYLKKATLGSREQNRESQCELIPQRSARPDQSGDIDHIRKLKYFKSSGKPLNSFNDQDTIGWENIFS